MPMQFTEVFSFLLEKLFHTHTETKLHTNFGGGNSNEKLNRLQTVLREVYSCGGGFEIPFVIHMQAGRHNILLFTEI